jgi:hypothetical protein
MRGARQSSALLSSQYITSFMPQREIYRGLNGDFWFLCRNEMGHVYVVHETEGKASAIGLGDFLSCGNAGPEHEALLTLIGSLTDPI